MKKKPFLNVIYLHGGFVVVVIKEAGFIAGKQTVLESILHDLLYYCPLKKTSKQS